MIWFCAALSAAWFLVHLFIGGREVAYPLRTERTSKTVVWATAYLCWHLTTGMLFCMAIFFGLGAWMGDTGLVLAGTLLAAITALVGIALPPILGLSYRVLPQGFLFVPIAVAGVIALI